VLTQGKISAGDEDLLTIADDAATVVRIITQAHGRGQEPG
jgi:hypothetical protein